MTMLTSSVPAFAAVTIADGDLVKATGSSAVYLVKGSTLRTFPYSTIYHSWGYPSNYSTVKTVAASDLSGYTIGDPVPFRDGTCFRGTAKSLVGFESQAVFCVSDAQLRPVESQNAFFGLFNVTNWTQGNKFVQYIPDDFLSKFDFAFGTKVTETEVNSGVIMNGLVVKGSVDGAYYLVQDGKLRALSTASAAANKIDLSKAIVTAQTKINAISSALPVSTTVESSLVTPKTKVEAQQGGSTTDITKAAKLVVSADKTTVEADGATKVIVTAKVATNEGATVSSATNNVTFAITSGSGTLSTSTVAAVNGVATVTLTSSTVASTIVVSATATGLTAGTVSVSATANTLAPTVSSVANSGMRIINVSFDKSLDKTTAETVTNYTVKNDKSSTVSVTSAKLLADAKTVQLFLAAGMYNNSSVDSVEVKNVQNAAQTSTMTTLTKELTVTDASVPTVVAVEALGSKAMRVTFSEAVQGVTTKDVATTLIYSAFRLDDKLMSSATGTSDTTTTYGVLVTYPDATDYTKALISFANPIAVGAHTLTVSYAGTITDYNVTTDGTANTNVMQPAGYVATVSADTSVPMLSSVEVLTQTKVRYTFSKAIETPSVNSMFWSTASNATSGTYASTMTKVSDMVYEATWGSAISTGTVYFYAGTISARVVDYSGNSISPLPSSRSLVVSTDTAPAISSVSMDTDSDRVVVIYFNKDVEEATAESSSNYVFKKAGVVLTSITGGEGMSSNGNPIATPVRDAVNLKKVTITLGSAAQDANAIPGGTYELQIKDVKTSGGTTAMSASAPSYTFSVTDKTRPTLKTTVAAFVDGTNISVAPHRIIVKFSEALDSASAANTSNYKLDLAGSGTWTKLSDVSGVSITLANSNKDVVITFADTTTLTTSTKLMIGYIDGSINYSPKDVSGNSFKGDANGQTISLSGAFNDATYPVAVVSAGLTTGNVTLKVKSPTLLQATFDRDIETISASEFKVINAVNADITPTSAEICTVKSTNCEEENAKVVMFTIPSGTSNEFTSNDTSVDLITRGTSALTSKDTLNLSVVFNTSLATTSTNDIKPVLKSFAVSNANTLILTFDGKVAGDAITAVVPVADNSTRLANDLIISQVVGTTTTTYTGVQLTVSPTADSTVVTVTLTSPTATLSLIDSVTVRTVSGDSITAYGTNGAKIAANTTGIQNASFVASAITEVLGTTATGYGYSIAGSEVLSMVTFNKNVDRTSIAGTWTTSNNVVYTQTGVSVTYNASTNKVSVNSVGEFEFTNLIVGGNETASASGTATLSLDTNANTLTITLTSAPSTATSYATGSTITFTPSSGIKTTVGTMISTDYKSVVVSN